jgi:hypothetical protein
MTPFNMPVAKPASSNIKGEILLIENGLLI